MGIVRFLGVVVLYAALSGASLAAPLPPVDTLQPQRTYRAGDFTLNVDGGLACDQAGSAKVEVRHSRENFLGRYPFQTQAFIRALSDALKRDCPGVTGLQATIIGANGKSQTEYLQVALHWQLSAVRQLSAFSAQEADAEARQRARDFSTATASGKHDLSNFGYFYSEKLGETPKFKLYLAREKERFSAPQYVAVHTTSGDTPFFETRTGTDGRIHIGPAFYAQVEAFLSRSVQPKTSPMIRHYLEDYFDPRDDRVKVLGPNAVQRGLFEAYSNVFWEGDRQKVSPYGSQICCISAQQKLTITRNAVIAAYGPSAPVEADENTPLPDYGPVQPEGPDETYLAAQAELRQKTLARGLIYKNDGFWAEFASPDTKLIFNAHAKWVGVGDLAAKALMMSYLSENSRQCRSTIKDPHRFRLQEVTTTTDSDGFSSTSTSMLYDIIVPGRFAPILDENFRGPDGFALEDLAQSLKMMASRSLQSMVRDAQNMRDMIERNGADGRRMLAQGPCANPVQKQFEEMVYLDAVGRSPETATQLSFANAAALSDRLYQPGQAKSLKGACLANFYNPFGFSRKNYAWCECVAARIRANAPSKTQLYTKRYRQFERDMFIIQQTLERGQKHPKSGFYYNYRSCAT